MDKYAAPTTYVKNSDRAREMADAEQPFRDAIYIHDTILAHFEEVLRDAKELADEYNELEQLVVPVSYDYLKSLFYADDFLDEVFTDHVLVKIFSGYMEEYDYDSDVLVPSVPLAYLMVRLKQYSALLKKHMIQASSNAERRYVASMN